MKERITKNGIDYVLVGDYYIPDLKLPEEERPIGKYGRMHRIIRYCLMNWRCVSSSGLTLLI